MQTCCAFINGYLWISGMQIELGVLGYIYIYLEVT